MRIRGPYDEFGMYETALLGILASASGWATAARACRDAAGDKPIFCFGARHVHPAVAPVMERASLIGGATDCSCIMGAKLLGREPVGTVPHAAILIIGIRKQRFSDKFAKILPIILVDTLGTQLRKAQSCEGPGGGFRVRLDTPAEGAV